MKHFVEVGTLPSIKESAKRRIVIQIIWVVANVACTTYVTVNLIWLIQPREQPDELQTYSMVALLGYASAYLCCSIVYVLATLLVMRIKRIAPTLEKLQQ